MIRFVTLSEKTRDWLGLTPHHHHPYSLSLHQLGCNKKSLAKAVIIFTMNTQSTLAGNGSNYHHNKHPVYISPFPESDLFKL